MPHGDGATGTPLHGRPEWPDGRPDGSANQMLRCADPSLRRSFAALRMTRLFSVSSRGRSPKDLPGDEARMPHGDGATGTPLHGRPEWPDGRPDGSANQMLRCADPALRQYFAAQILRCAQDDKTLLGVIPRAQPEGSSRR